MGEEQNDENEMGCVSNGDVLMRMLLRVIYSSGVDQFATKLLAIIVPKRFFKNL